MMNVNVAREAAPKTAPMATSAKAPGERCAFGMKWFDTMAKMPPMAALHMKQGASNPPEVPDPSETAKAAALANITTSKIFHPVKEFAEAHSGKTANHS